MSDRRIKVTLFYGQDELSTYQSAQSLAQIIAGIEDVQPAIIQLTQTEIARPMQGLCLCCRMHAELSSLLRDAFMQALQKRHAAFSHIIVCARSDTDPANIVHTLTNDFFVKERYVFWDVVSCLTAEQLSLLSEQLDELVMPQEMMTGQLDVGQLDVGRLDVGRLDVEQLNVQESEQSDVQGRRRELKYSQLFATDLFLVNQQDGVRDCKAVMNALVEGLQSMRAAAAVWHRQHIYPSQDFDQLAFVQYTTDLLAREQTQQRIMHRPVSGRLFGAGLFR